MKTNGSSLFWIETSQLETLARQASGGGPASRPASGPASGPALARQVAAAPTSAAFSSSGSGAASSGSSSESSVPRTVRTETVGRSEAAPQVPRFSLPEPVKAAAAIDTESKPSTPTHATDDPRLRSSSLATRLDGLMDWLVGFGIDSAFVVDSDGLALVHHQGDTPLMAAAAAVETKWEELSQRLSLAPEKAMVLHLDSGSFLHLLGTDTTWGRLCLGVLGQQLLSRTSLSDIREMFDRLVLENFGTTSSEEQHGS